MICTLCPRMCHAERSETQGNGFCGMGTLPVLARAALHFDEEPVISGTRGSGALFFSGCSLACAFCQNYEISAERFGKVVSIERLRACYQSLIDAGAHTINLVNPTHFTDAILDSLTVPLGVPVVWNSSGYERVETLARLEGKVDVYLPDLKYADSDAAQRYSRAPDYFAHARTALKEMLRQTGPVELDDEGIIRRGTIVRHLILPGQIENTRRVLRFIADELPGVWVSLMAQYVPYGRASEFPEINRRITRKEYASAVRALLALGLEKGFVQELESADTQYIPSFDLTGVEAESEHYGG